MAPSRGGRKTVVISDDEGDQFEIDWESSDDAAAVQKLKSNPESPLKALKDNSRKSKASRPASPRTTPQKKTKGKAPAPKQENGKTKGTIFSFFNAATRRQQAVTQTPATTTDLKHKITDEDIVDGIDDDGAITLLNGSKTAFAARKRKQNDVAHLFDPAVFAAASASQKFRKTSLGSKVSTNKVVDRRPWTEQFGPVDLTELAVHKKKVSDVRTLLEESLSSRARPRLIVLKGPAGAGKTTTLYLLAKDVGVRVREWRNPTEVDFASKNSTSTSAQFEDFIFRGGSLAGLELVTDTNVGIQGRPPHPNDEDHSTEVRNIILIEEFPVSLTRSSPILQSFRSTLLAYLSARHNPSRPAAPIFLVLSETLLSSNSSSESMTPHRILGPSLLSHPLTATIEFNPIAPTLLTKALSLAVTKESRVSGRRRTPGLPVLAKLAEMGDIRSALSALEFLCLRGDEEDAWSAKVNFSKSKGKAASKNGTKAAEGTMTEQEREALKIVGGRETALDLWHGVGKVVYNKRIDCTFSSESTTQRVKMPENDPEQLLVELSTDTSTFIAAIHENFVLSCAASAGTSSIDAMDNCLMALSDADTLSLERFGPGQGPGTALEGMRQEEIAFHAAIRGVVYSLPYPVKRETTGTTANRSRAFVMAWPRSLRLWRDQEEIDDLADLCLEEYRTVLTERIRQGEKDESGNLLDQDAPSPWRPSAASKVSMIQEQAPYMRLVHKAKRTSLTLQDHVAKLSRFETLHASTEALAGHTLGEDAGEEDEEVGKSPSRSRRSRVTTTRLNELDVEEEVKGLVLSDDDIVDD